jgi:hypothetical protein
LVNARLALFNEPDKQSRYGHFVWLYVQGRCSILLVWSTFALLALIRCSPYPLR